MSNMRTTNEAEENGNENSFETHSCAAAAAASNLLFTRQPSHTSPPFLIQLCLIKLNVEFMLII
jgi:hypothetical protein